VTKFLIIIASKGHTPIFALPDGVLVPPTKLRDENNDRRRWRTVI
jgi:hypothetical protein